jgi:hypothetical protein
MSVFKREIFLDFCYVLYLVQHCFICSSSESTVSEDAGIELRTAATVTLAIRRSNNSSHMTKFCFTELAKIYLSILVSLGMVVCNPLPKSG